MMGEKMGQREQKGLVMKGRPQEKYFATEVSTASPARLKEL